MIKDKWNAVLSFALQSVLQYQPPIMTNSCKTLVDPASFTSSLIALSYSGEARDHRRYQCAIPPTRQCTMYRNTRSCILVTTSGVGI